MPRVRQILDIVIGADVAFLPAAMLLALQEGLYSIPVSMGLWAITTWIVLGEWWGLKDTLEEPTVLPDRIAPLFVLYMCGLLFLPLSLVLGKSPSEAIKFYVCVLIVLSFLDIPIEAFCSRAAEKAARKECQIYMFMDLVVIFLYSLCLVVFFVSSTRISIVTDILIVALVYLIDFVLYIFLAKFLASGR